MSHKESLEYRSEEDRLSWDDRLKKAGVTAVALATSVGAVFGLSGCGNEKAGAEAVPSTPAASSPKTPETTKTPEKTVTLSFEAKAYEQRLDPVNLKGKTQEEMTAMWAASQLPSIEDDSSKEALMKRGMFIYAGIDALAQACASPDLINPIDSDGIARPTEELEDECRPYYKAAVIGMFGDNTPASDHIGTLMFRMMYRNAGQSALIHGGNVQEMKIPANTTKYSYFTKLNNLSVGEDGSIHISLTGCDMVKSCDLDSADAKWTRDYSKTLNNMLGPTTAKKVAITKDSLSISYTPKSGAYYDMAKCVGDSSGTPCK